MRTSHIFHTIWLSVGLTAAMFTSAHAANPGIIEPGMAAATCHATTYITNPADRYVLAVMDVRVKPSNFSGGTAPSYSNLWNPAVYHHADWTQDKLGNVFGLAMDCDCNLYVTAIAQAPNGTAGGIAGFGSLGGYNPASPNSTASVEAGGAIYKIDGVTGVPTLFAKLPQRLNSVFHDNGVMFHANGLGQIAYDHAHDQLFVSNREDGKIYRLSMAGVVLSTLDPGTPDPGTNAPATDAEFVWALAVNLAGDRLYYSFNSTSVRSVALDAAGGFAGSDRLEFTVPWAYERAKISDLAFKRDGSQLLVSQRNHDTSDSFVKSYNHRSMAYLYNFNSSTGLYTLNRSIQVGDDRESYGGVAFAPLNTDPLTGQVTDQDGMLWFSSADILDGSGPHGLEAVPVTELNNLASGNLLAADSSGSYYTAHRNHVYVIDFDGLPSIDTKGSGGDVDILGGGLDGFCLVCEISGVTVTPGTCNDNGTPSNQTDDYYTASVTVNYTNPPTTGNLVLSGAALHSTNTVTTVSVAAIGASSYTFSGVRLKANGIANSITATFSADPACTLTINAPSVSNCSTPPPACLISAITVTPGACNDNGTANNSADDYYTASVTVNYTNPPTTGNLVLSGDALHSTNTVTTVPVSSIGATSYTFSGVRIKADGVSHTIIATFQ